MKSFIKALRAPFVLISGLNFFSLWYACALPLNPIFFLGLTGILLAHLSSNLWNDYFDFTADSLNQTPTVFSGGSRVLQDGEITKRSFLIFSIILSFISLVIGILLIFMATRPAATLLVITTTSLIGFFYTAPPLRLVYRGFGEISIALSFGPLIYIGILALTGIDFGAREFVFSICLGLLTARILYVNEFPDYEADLKASKKTLVVILKPIKANRLLFTFSLLCIVCLNAASINFTPKNAFLFIYLILTDLLLYKTAIFFKKSLFAQLTHVLFALGFIAFF